MQIYSYPDKSLWPELTRRPVVDQDDLYKSVRKILAKTKAKGDKALKKFTWEFDGIQLKKLVVSEKEISEALALVPEELKLAIQQARQNIGIFHKAQQEASEKVETMPGILCWRQDSAIEKVGFYIPGGSAPLFSTILMLAVPASLAGCKEIILCTPPGTDGKIHPAILYTAQLCGIHKLFKVGGAQAIAAMAYGTETIPKVYKIFGPGNQYVTLAKQLIQEEGIAIDMPAGPSELLVIADGTAEPAFVAADLLSQAEHGPDSQVILVTTDSTMAYEVKNALAHQLDQLPRKKIASLALEKSKLVIVKDLNEALAFSNHYAPEHLILACSGAEDLGGRVINAGSVFIGNYSPESAGDYASGTNHTLPTNGYAAMYSGVSLDSFVKKISFQQLSKEGLERIGPTVMNMAAAEGLEAHRNAVAIRIKK